MHRTRECPNANCNAIPFILSKLSLWTLAAFEDNNAGDDADDEEDFANEYAVTPAILEGLLEREDTRFI